MGCRIHALDPPPHPQWSSTRRAGWSPQRSCPGSLWSVNKPEVNIGLWGGKPITDASRANAAPGQSPARRPDPVDRPPAHNHSRQPPGRGGKASDLPRGWSKAALPPTSDPIGGGNGHHMRHRSHTTTTTTKNTANNNPPPHTTTHKDSTMSWGGVARAHARRGGYPPSFSLNQSDSGNESCAPRLGVTLKKKKKKKKKTRHKKDVCCANHTYCPHTRHHPLCERHPYAPPTSFSHMSLLFSLSFLSP
jgi:hypothetical protein